jgi:hypothetical protein
MRADGVLAVACNGQIDARSGTFTDGAGNTTTLGPGAVVTTGAVTANGGLLTPAVDAFVASDPNTIVVKAGDLFVKNPAGTALLRVAANGDVTGSHDLIAEGELRARQFTLTATVNEGDSCTEGQVAMMATGGLATCQNAQFQATSRYARLGAACGVNGQPATDSSSGEALVCRGGYFASVSGLLTSRVYMAGFSVGHGAFIPVAQALPNGCPATAGPVAPEATIYLLPQTDVNTLGNQVLNRNAQWTGSGWTISLTDGTGAGTTSLAVAEVYCLYP